MASAVRNDPLPVPTPTYTVTLELDKEEAGFLCDLLYRGVAGSAMTRGKPLYRIYLALQDAKVERAVVDHDGVYGSFDLVDGETWYHTIDRYGDS